MINIDLLKNEKRKLGLSYDQIAELSGIPRRTVISIFMGQTKTPRIDTLESIEKALGIQSRHIASVNNKEESQKTPKFTVISNKTDFELSKEEKALILTLRRSNNAKAYIRAMITMLGETRTIDQILSK